MNMMNRARETSAFATAISRSNLVKLQTWFSPSLPIGAFGYSHGLEWSVEAGDVDSASSLCAWVDSVLRYSAGRSDAIVLCHIARAVSSQDWSAAEQVNSLAVALQPTTERRLESLGQGAAFLSAISAGWPHPTLAAFREICPGDVSLPAAAGAAAAAHDLPLDCVVIAYLHAFVANLVSAGVRLVPLGQTDGLKVSAALESAILKIAVEAGEADLDDLGSAGILVDIASMLHETQYTRLFRS